MSSRRRSKIKPFPEARYSSAFSVEIFVKDFVCCLPELQIISCRRQHLKQDFPKRFLAFRLPKKNPRITRRTRRKIFVKDFFLRYKRYSWQFPKMIFLRYSWQLTVLENVFFKMPQRKVNVITERRMFGDDNDLPHDIRDMKSGFSGDSLLRYSSDTGSMTSVACLPLCILCFVFVFVKVTAYRHFTFAV